MAAAASFGLRCARVAEAKAIHQLLWSAREEIPLKESFNAPDRVEWTRKLIKRKAYWVREVDGELAGAMYLSGREIFYLVVAAHFRRRGIARRFIGYAKARFPTVLGRTDPKNRAINDLLRSEGFRVDHTRDIRDWTPWVWERSRSPRVRA